jgi:DNA invertase Pin-like site-specific DNA recombinase
LATRVVGYIRVSTEGQADNGISLEAQRAKLEAYALAMDLELVAIEEDAGLSAKTVAGRPGLLHALARLDAGEAEGILVVKLDRLTRSVRDLGDLVERYFARRWSLLSLGDSIDTRTASGRLVLHIIASVAQWEREATAERTVAALAHLRDTGVRLGGEALGWCRTPELDADGRRATAALDGEALTVRRIHELHGLGFSLRGVAATLVSEGHATKRGGAWRPATVRKVLLRGGSPGANSGGSSVGSPGA